MLKNHYLKEEIKILDRDEEVSLIEKYQETRDKDILEKLIVSNIKFIIEKAGQLYGDVPKSDLIQEGILALILSIENFNKDKSGGTRLLTFAHKKIKGRMIRSIESWRKHSGDYIKRRISWR